MRWNEKITPNLKIIFLKKRVIKTCFFSKCQIGTETKDWNVYVLISQFTAWAHNTYQYQAIFYFSNWKINNITPPLLQMNRALSPTSYSFMFLPKLRHNTNLLLKGNWKERATNICCFLWLNEAAALCMKDNVISKLASNISSQGASKRDLSPKVISPGCCAAHGACCYGTSAWTALSRAPSAPLLAVINTLQIHIWESRSLNSHHPTLKQNHYGGEAKDHSTKAGDWGISAGGGCATCRSKHHTTCLDCWHSGT